MLSSTCLYCSMSQVHVHVLYIYYGGSLMLVLKDLAVQCTYTGAEITVALISINYSNMTCGSLRLVM